MKIFTPFSHNHGSVENHPKMKGNYCSIGARDPFSTEPWLWEEGYSLLVHDLRFESYEGISENLKKIQGPKWLMLFWGDNSAGGYFWLKQFRWRYPRAMVASGSQSYPETLQPQSHPRFSEDHPPKIEDPFVFARRYFWPEESRRSETMPKHFRKSSAQALD